MKGLQPATNGIQSLKERKGHSNKWRSRMLHKVKETASQNLTTVVTGWKTLKISSALLLLLKKTMWKKTTAKVLTVKKCNGEEHDTLTYPHQLKSAPNFRKSNTIAPIAHNYFVTGWGPLHIFPHHFLPSQCKKAGDGSATAHSPTPAPPSGNRRLLLLLSS